MFTLNIASVRNQNGCRSKIRKKSHEKTSKKKCIFDCISIFENRSSKISLFWCQGIFFRNLDFKNGCKNVFDYNIDKICSWSKTGFPQNWFLSHLDSRVQSDSMGWTIWKRRVSILETLRNSKRSKTFYCFNYWGLYSEFKYNKPSNIFQYIDGLKFLKWIIF